MNELSRPKSSRDSLLAPLRPLPPPSKGDEAVRLLVREARAEGMREAGEAVGDDEESEGEELRKAVEVSDGLSEVLERIKLTFAPRLFPHSELLDGRKRNGEYLKMNMLSNLLSWMNGKMRLYGDQRMRIGALLIASY